MQKIRIDILTIFHIQLLFVRNTQEIRNEKDFPQYEKQQLQKIYGTHYTQFVKY